MTDRHLAALSSLTHGASLGGTRYYESQMTTSASTTTTTAVPLLTKSQTILQYQQQQQQQHQQTLQQRLLYQQQQQLQEQRYYASGYQLHPSYAQSYGAAASVLSQQQQQQHSSYLSHQHVHPYMEQAGYPHYEAAFRNRVINTGGSRYSPYHHHLQQQHEQHHHQSLHGLYSAAGQQLIPTSVLHYPPRNNSAYQATNQQQRAEQMLLHHHHRQQQERQQQQRLYEQQQLQQRQRAYLHNLNDATYNPYRISEHHYQQAQMSLLSSQQLQQQEQQQNRCLTPLVQNSPSHATTTESDVPPRRNSSRTGGELQQQQQQMPQQPETSSAICLTTSPPLISAGGTDSGISSSGCSTRGGTRNGSTQSTPIYSSEYPLSVGSSSGVSHHYADGKELDDVTNGAKELMRANRDEELNAKELFATVKEEFIENCHTSEDQQGQPIQDDAKKEMSFEIGNSDAQHKIEENQTEGVCTKATPFPNDINTKNLNTKLDVCPYSPRQQFESSTQLTSNTNDSCLPKESSAKREECCKTPFVQALLQKTFQDKKEQDPTCTNSFESTNQMKKEPNDKWSPIPNSPNNWMHNYSPSCDMFTKTEIASPTVPSPPHNSPVDYQPPTDPVQVFSETTIKSSANKKNIRNGQHGALALIKRTKCKKSARVLGEAVDDGEDIANERCGEMKDTTPLPGFQQTFGSTEIGRFSETFLIAPDDCNTVEQYGCFDENHQQQHQIVESSPGSTDRYGASQNSWTSFDPYIDYANSAQLQYSMRYATAVSQNGHYGYGYRPYDSRYGLREAMLIPERFASVAQSNNNFNEIRCNGY